MLTIKYEEGSFQILDDFHESFLVLNKYERAKLIKDLVNDIAKGSKCTYTWQDLV